MASGDREILAPLRMALAEAAAAEGFRIPDLEVAVAAIMGSIYMSVVQPYSRGREVDPELIADSIVSQVVHGITGASA